MTSRFLEDFLGIQFFGEFLIDRWVINREQLIEALEYQMARNERFGSIAVKKGYLTTEQVSQINDRQRVTDMTFGEMAVAMGLLEDGQVREVVRFQRNNNLYLGEALLRLGYVNDELLARELAFFREHQKRFSGDDLDVAGSPRTLEIVRAGVDITSKMFRRILGMTIKTGRAAVIGSRDDKGRDGYHVTVSIAFVDGPDTIHFLLSVTREIAFAIAENILKSDPTHESEIMIADAVKEFCNFICGNAVAKAAQKGIEVEITPPAQLAGIPDAPPGYATLALPVRLTRGGIDLRFHVPAMEGPPEATDARSVVAEELAKPTS